MGESEQAASQQGLRPIPHAGSSMRKTSARALQCKLLRRPTLFQVVGLFRIGVRLQMAGRCVAMCLPFLAIACGVQGNQQKDSDRIGDLAGVEVEEERHPLSVADSDSTTRAVLSVGIRGMAVGKDDEGVLPVRSADFRASIGIDKPDNSLSGELVELATGRTVRLDRLSLAQGAFAGFDSLAWLVDGQRIFVLGQLREEGAVLFVDLVPDRAIQGWMLAGPELCARDKRLSNAKHLLRLPAHDTVAVISGEDQVVVIDVANCKIVGSTSPVDGAFELVPALTSDENRPGGFDLLVEGEDRAVKAFLYYDSSRNLVDVLRRKENSWILSKN